MTTINTTYSLAQALQQLQTQFSTADTDGNKSLSSAEFAAAVKTNPNLAAGTTAAAEFAKLDTDKDGAVTKNELTQGLNLTTQVYSVLLQGQEIASGGIFAQLLGDSSGGSSSLFGNSNNFSGLTSSLLGGGSSSTSLISMLTGGNANTTTLAELFGSSDNTSSQLQSILSKYIDA